MVKLHKTFKINFYYTFLILMAFRVIINKPYNSSFFLIKLLNKNKFQKSFKIKSKKLHSLKKYAQLQNSYFFILLKSNFTNKLPVQIIFD